MKNRFTSFSTPWRLEELQFLNETTTQTVSDPSRHRAKSYLDSES